MPVDPKTGKWKQLPAEAAGRMAVGFAMKALAAAYLAEFANLDARLAAGDAEVAEEWPNLGETTAREWVEGQFEADDLEGCVLQYVEEQVPEVCK